MAESFCEDQEEFTVPRRVQDTSGGATRRPLTSSELRTAPAHTQTCFSGPEQLRGGLSSHDLQLPGGTQSQPARSTAATPLHFQFPQCFSDQFAEVQCS